MRLLISSAGTLLYMVSCLSAKIGWCDRVTPDWMAFESSEDEPRIGKCYLFNPLVAAVSPVTCCLGAEYNRHYYYHRAVAIR